MMIRPPDHFETWKKDLEEPKRHQEEGYQGMVRCCAWLSTTTDDSQSSEVESRCRVRKEDPEIPCPEEDDVIVDVKISFALLIAIWQQCRSRTKESCDSTELFSG